MLRSTCLGVLLLLVLLTGGCQGGESYQFQIRADATEFPTLRRTVIDTATAQGFHPRLHSLWDPETTCMMVRESKDPWFVVVAQALIAEERLLVNVNQTYDLWSLGRPSIDIRDALVTELEAELEAAFPGRVVLVDELDRHDRSKPRPAPTTATP